ncbi:MAG TPA: glycoside hydrolase family 88 protein [Cyclobacteriaceae bacterium]|nr:glycoside hydrolase family 88 protein [Cyclobacteriaceae bacterium]
MKTILIILLLISRLSSFSQTPYGRTTPGDVKLIMDKVFAYADQSTPVGIINRTTGQKIIDLKNPIKEAGLVKTEFNIASHEWGLAYSSMMLASETTGDKHYQDYVAQHFEFLGLASPYFRAYAKSFPSEVNPLEHFLSPQSLDDTGSMCAAMIQGLRGGMSNNLRPEIDNAINIIVNKIYRLPDGTFARNRPFPNSVWVDDLYQGIPALAQMGKLTGEKKYYDEAARQVLLFADKLFVKDKGLCMHGRVEDMNPHPAFLWARANGWAILAISGLLDVLPEDHPKRKEVFDLYKAYCQGLASLQSSKGFWHQLMDRNDSFPETSATAMFTYIFAHGITQGWLDIRAYGPPALLGWNAVSTKVNEKGQVEGTSAGTSMAFDAAFYYERPVGTGPHGYGSLLIAGAAMYKLLKEHDYEGRGPVLFNK